MNRSPNRVFLGSVAGALSVLLFHQTSLQILFWIGLAPQPAFRLAHVPPFFMPMVVSLTFWGAVYGALFGFVSIRLPGRLIWYGIPLGLAALAMSWFVFLPLKGLPIAFGGDVAPMARSAMAYLLWGIGVTVLLPLVFPRRIRRPRSATPPHVHA
ncbi:hypothetical protein [Rhodopila sp.]|jgi:hypothetical protein|uniref:hypothetical protein n=1 Tax=Rhodopila sp. TaxID=2480087 RepID=UPI002BA9B332|nr:hypothetical protein [Rhodopila sp.]HVZ06414.1 hypothetical protein [Rhodopila sp.]